jgi:formylglycine-generating enzyme required for sulfatase activity
MTPARFVFVAFGATLLAGCNHPPGENRPAFLKVTPYTELGCTHAAVVADCNNGWCQVPAGCFVMGSPETEWSRGLDTEQTLKVTFTRSFEIAQYETTQAQWEAMGFANPRTEMPFGRDGKGPNVPVGNVNWYEALAYANSLSAAHDPPLPSATSLVCAGASGATACPAPT